MKKYSLYYNDVHMKWFDTELTPTEWLENYINKLPSVLKEDNTEQNYKVIDIDKCKKYKTYKESYGWFKEPVSK